MDTRYEIPPRLRLNRQASSFAATVDDSNFHNTFNLDRERDGSDGGDDDGSTPRLGGNKASMDSFDEPLHFSSQAQAQSTPFPLRDAAADREATPAERLRAVLSRASSLTPIARIQNVPLDKTPMAGATNLRESDMESEDFETPRNAANGVPATPYAQSQNSTVSVPSSVARESVRNIFANALRSPGNTPERRRRPRRGSVDSSIVEESPMKWSMLNPGERVKRLSLSDDEKERIKASRPGWTDERSIDSFTSSQAAIYDQLRQRLEGPRADHNASKGKAVAKSDMTIDMEEATEVEEELFKDRKVPIKPSTPPAPSNMTTGQQSMSQFPSQFLGSNLLTENSDMRRMIEEAQTDTTDSEAPQSSQKSNKTPIAGPASVAAKARPTTIRQRTLSRNGSISSLSSSSSRSTSRQSINDIEDEDLKHERERGWNHPLGPYIERHRATSPLYSMKHSGGLAGMRRVSLGSISGSESDAGRFGLMSSAKKQDDHQDQSKKYASISSGRFSSASPNRAGVSARIRTVSQPVKPSSPRSLASSTNSDGTQKPVDRTRTISSTTRDSSRQSLSHVQARPDAARNRNSAHIMERAVRPVSPPSSRSSSRASHQSESPGGVVQIKVRERNWSSPRHKLHATGSPSYVPEKKQAGNTGQVRTPPAYQTSRARDPHATGASPSSIPKLSVNNGRSNAARRTGAIKGSEVIGHKARNSSESTTISVNGLVNGKRTSDSMDKDVMQPAKSNPEKAFSQHEYDPGHPHPEPPTTSADINGSGDSEEHDTPRIGQQHIPDSSTPDSGSRPNSRTGTSSMFPSHGLKAVDNRAKVHSSTTVSVGEKEHHRSDPEQSRNTRPSRVSMASEPVDLHDSDLDSFQEEDIVASSSVPRLPRGNDSFDESDTNSQTGESHAGNVLRSRRDLRLNGQAQEPDGKGLSLPANFSPPLSPPVSPPDPVTSTPRRRGSANSSKLEFRTPTPPKGMPALPEPPSSDDDAAGQKTPLILATPANRNRYAEMKTPRLPGAWATPFATPAPAVAARITTLPRDSQPEGNRVTIQNEIHTPPASYSRATSMAMKTPAPPGAWLPTPANIAAKRLQQKVRFDQQEKTAASDSVPTDDDGMLSSDVSAGDGSVAMKAAGRGITTSPRSPARIRVVDAFGNEIVPSKIEDEKSPIQGAGELHATERGEKSITSASRKTRVRVLDAMGREIREPQVQSSLPVDEPAKRSTKSEDDNVTTSFQRSDVRKVDQKQALQMLQKTIAELKDDFKEIEEPVSTRTAGDVDTEIADLKAQSIRARENRERLLLKIRDTETGRPPSRLRAMWNVLLFGKNSVGIVNRSAYFKVFVALILLQVVVFLAFYRLTSMSAQRLFLTTYIDPFYPELYLHVTNPDVLPLSMPPNAYSAPSRFISPSWLEPVLATLHAIVRTLKESLWDTWRDTPQNTPWPPT